MPKKGAFFSQKQCVVDYQGTLKWILKFLTDFVENEINIAICFSILSFYLNVENSS
jgi:hypothetical protein